MSERYPGGFITKDAPAPSGPYGTNTASGIWTLDQQAQYQSAGNWPVVGGPFDPNFENVTMLLHGDGTNGGQNNTFLDASTNNFTITRNGNTTQGSFSPYGPNWSNLFGSGNYLSAASNAAFAMGTGDFTVEAWVFPNAAYTTFNYILGVAVTNGLVFYVTGGNLVVRSFNGSDLLSSATIPALNTWTHVAATRSGTTLRIFVNGVQTATTTNSTNFVQGAAYVGNDSTNVAPWLGYISNFRLVKGTALYTANFTPSTTPLTAVSGTSLLTCQSNRFIDNSTNNFTITTTGTPSVQRFSPFAPPAAYSTATIGGSGYFDGTGDYLTIGSGSLTLNARTEVFTFETWFYWTGGTSANLLGSATTTGFYIFIDGTYYVGDGVNNPITAAGSFLKNVWVYVALSFDGTTYRLYSNGALVGSTTTLLANNTVTPSLGAYNNGAAPLFTGYMAGSRLVKGSALYTGSAMTVPTAPPTAIANTSFLCNFTNAAIFDNAMMNDLETVGNAQISTSVVKYGTGSLNFAANDGSAYLLLPSSENTALGGDFTIEFWLNPDTVSTSYAGSSLATIFDADAGAGVSSTAWWAIHQQNSTLVFSANNANILTSDAELSASTWQHCAVVRSGTTVTWYIDGVAEGSTTYSTAVTGPRRLFIAKQSGAARFYKGYIDDLRITKGVARYTADFTPPTAAFPNL